MAASVGFVLELYYEAEGDRLFADGERKKLLDLLKDLAPHIVLDVHVLLAPDPTRTAYGEGTIPVQRPRNPEHQSLLITHETLAGSKGKVGAGQLGCISRQSMAEDIAKGWNSANITVHEWIHTLWGKGIGGHRVRTPDRLGEVDPEADRFPCRVLPSGETVWHDWYRHLLRQD